MLTHHCNFVYKTGSKIYRTDAYLEKKVKVNLDEH